MTNHATARSLGMALNYASDLILTVCGSDRLWAVRFILSSTSQPEYDVQL